MKLKFFPTACLFFLFLNKLLAQNFDVRVMSWNVLNWPSNSNLVPDTTSRCPSYRAVMAYAQPDVLITMENTSMNSAPWFRDQVMNSGIYHYQSGTFIDGYDTDNCIYYRDSLFDFVSNVPIQTPLRDISDFTLVFKPTGDTIHIFSCHLKASQGFEQNRLVEVNDLRAVTNALPSGTNFLVGGDFNIYTSGEPCYGALLQDNATDDGNFNDPVHITGIWNNYSYRFYHTQSTRTNAAGGGAGGGMNDRFDMLLYSNGVKDPTGAYYVPGSFHNIGNDGLHYDEAINDGPNNSVPAGVADALENASDHLPVMLTLSFGPTAGIDEHYQPVSSVEIIPNPVQDHAQLRFNLRHASEVQYSVSDITGRILSHSDKLFFGQGSNDIDLNLNNIENAGIYFVSVQVDNFLINKKIILFR